MQQIAIIGIGQTPVSENWEQSIREIAGRAILDALHDANRENVDGIFTGNMLSGMLSGQESLGALIADWVGLKNVEAMKIEAACGSGAAAFRAALMAIGSGELESAVVVGIEKMTEKKGPEVTEALATAADADYEVIHGLSFVALNALIMQRYLYEYGWHHTDFAPFSINAHQNAIHNPFARLHEEITREDYQKARMIADPINLLDASPTGDGAAAVVLVSARKPGLRADTNGRPRITIVGSAASTDSLAVHSRKDPLWLSAAEKSAKSAYSQASIKPADVDLFELHDAFSIMSALSLEACGFAERGKGPVLGLNSEIRPSGRIPISTMGGLKARGHPVGATGVYQIVEVVQQLRGEAGANQVPGARIGMAQNIGGSGASIITHLLKVN
jgi:acetyl-CoA C-acetyltransferase